MAFRASNLIPQQGYNTARAVALRIQHQSTNWATTFGSGGDFEQIWNCYRQLKDAYSRLDEVRTITGIGQYAKDQENDQNYDVATEFNALLSALTDAYGWIEGALPVDANDYLLVYKKIDTALTPRTFTSGQLSQLVTYLNAVVSAVS